MFQASEPRAKNAVASWRHASSFFADSFGPANSLAANLRGQGPRAEAERRAGCDVRAANSGARQDAGGVPPSESKQT